MKQITRPLSQSATTLRKASLLWIVLLGFIFTATGCQTAYYSFWEKLGREKRDLLEANVQKAEDDQKKVQKQFKDTLSRIRAEFDVKGGNLEHAYDTLASDQENAKQKAETLKSRIKNVKQIADDLFAEWSSEAKSIETPALRSDSQAKLRASQTKFNRMYASMQKVERAMDPILTRLNDQVLYLKHNLNAKALNALQGELKNVEKQIEELNRSILTSIESSKNFTQEFQHIN